MFFEVNYFIVLGSVIFLAFCLIGLWALVGIYEERASKTKKVSGFESLAVGLSVVLALIVTITLSCLGLSNLAISPVNDFSQADRINYKIFEKKVVEVSEIDSLSSDSKKTVYNTRVDDFKGDGYISLSGVKGDDSINLRVSFKNDTMIIKSSVVAEGSETKTYKYAL